MRRKEKRLLAQHANDPIVRPQANPNVQVCDFSPKPQLPNVITLLPNSANYQANVRGTICGLPKYMSTDEYGRIFEVNTFYGPQPCSGPVPIPTPCSLVQTAPINAPMGGFTPQ